MSKSQEWRLLVCPTHKIYYSMTIICREPIASQWPVVISKTYFSNCCIDVFEAIYETFQESLTAQEEHRLRCDKGEEFWTECQKWAKKRHGIYGPEGFNRRVRLRGVDVLRGKTIFDGIKWNGNEWELSLRYRTETDPPEVWYLAP